LFTKGAGTNAEPIADSVLLFLLSAAKSFPYFLEQSLRGTWPDQRPAATEMMGSRALIIGYGAIGHRGGRRPQAFGVDITGVRRTHDGEPGVIGPQEWRARLHEFDWIVVTAALTAKTRHVLSSSEFEQMSPRAWIVNVARGGLIDQPALVAAI